MKNSNIFITLHILFGRTMSCSTLKMNTRKLPNLMLFLSLAVFFFHQASGQRYKLKDVVVELRSGKKISGELVSAIGDSLVMIDKAKMAVGSKVTVQHKLSKDVIRGTVQAITDSTLVLSEMSVGFVDKEEAYVIWLRQIDRVKLNSYPPALDVRRFQRTAIGYPEIEYVGIHKKGSGALGFILGSTIGIVVAGAVTPGMLSSYEAFFTVSILAPLVIVSFGVGGAEIMSSIKKHFIHGDKGKFDAFVKKLKISPGVPTEEMSHVELKK